PHRRFPPRSHRDRGAPARADGDCPRRSRADGDRRSSLAGRPFRAVHHYPARSRGRGGKDRRRGPIDAASRRLRTGPRTPPGPAPDGTTSWRMAVPVMRGGRMVGATDVDVSLAEVYRLEHTLRLTDLAFLGSSIVLICFLLAMFLERRVTHPVAALVGGMQHV